MKKRESNILKTLLIIGMLVLSIAGVTLFSYLYGKSWREIFLLDILCVLCYGATVFSLIQSTIYHALHYDNSNHYARFILIYLIGVLCALLFPLMPSNAWMFPVLALGLTLFSNLVTGTIAYTGLLSICVNLADESSLTFLVYCTLGIVIAALFDRADKEYKTGMPIFISTLLYIVVMLAKLIFGTEGELNVESFIMPLINTFVTLLCMLGILRMFYAIVVDVEKGHYLEINDQEFPLLAKYKDENPQLYYNAIHTAYFTEKLARSQGMDVDLAKNGGYYHKIIANECKVEELSIEEICKKYKFPKEAIELLEEYNYKSKPLKMKESTTVYLVDSVVSSLLYIISKEENRDKEMDLGAIAVAALKRKTSTDVLNYSDISISDLVELERLFKEEKLYYDFLRTE